MVVNNMTGLPGKGIWPFFQQAGEGFDQLSRAQKTALVNKTLATVYAYPKWPLVLADLGLPPSDLALAPTIEAMISAMGGGESPEHKTLKDFVAQHPESIGLSLRARLLGTEYLLPSGDLVDVFFEAGRDQIAVEVKSKISNDADVARGMFQCVKYRGRSQRMVCQQESTSRCESNPGS